MVTSIQLHFCCFFGESHPQTGKRRLIRQLLTSSVARLFKSCLARNRRGCRRRVRFCGLGFVHGCRLILYEEILPQLRLQLLVNERSSLFPTLAILRIVRVLVCAADLFKEILL